MIVLSVLKWIGIVLGITLLAILALVIFILLLVLFVPVRYRVGLRTGHKEDEKLAYSFGVFWLLHAISVRKDIDAKETVIRILGIPIKRIGGESKEDEPDDRQYEAESLESEYTEESEYPEAEYTEKSENAEEDHGDGDEYTEESELEEESGYTEGDHEEEADKNPITRLFTTISDKIKDIKKKIRDTFMKIDFIFFKISSIMDIVKDRVARKTIKRLMKEIVALIRYVGPNGISGHLEFGTGDPGTTGMILGGVSLMKIAYRKDVSIVPNFEDKCLIADAGVWGRIRAVYFVRMALRIWFDKDVHKLWKRYRRMKKAVRKREKAMFGDH
ncbi:MAG TPA: hypothetical protein DCP06_01510 [Lachnospiraceae bacterium]|nr:hypothetical protein [Lachnospiraceae bacterium]